MYGSGIVVWMDRPGGGLMGALMGRARGGILSPVLVVHVVRREIHVWMDVLVRR